MEGFELSIVINRSVEEVFAVLANLENDVKWRREWVDARKTSEGPIGLGSTFRLVGQFLCWRSETVYEVIEYEPNRIVSWKTVSGPLPLTFRRIFERVGGGTRVTIRYEAEPHGFLKLAMPLLVRMGKRQLGGDFPKLKELMETRAL